MDIYVRTLSLSLNQSVHECVESCGKLIAWLYGSHQDERTQLTYKDVETMCKALLYLHDCFMLHDVEELKQAILIQYPWLRCLLDDFCQQLNVSECCMQKLCMRIVCTKGGREHIPTLAYMLEILGDIQPAWHIKRIDFERMMLQCGTTKDQSNINMLRIVERIFQLPNRIQIETATRRLLVHLPFEVLCQLFMTTSECNMHNKCTILAHYACQELLQNKEPTATKFVHNIYKCTAANSNGLQQYFWPCLNHKQFAYSLMKYLLHYIDANIIKSDFEEEQLQDKIYVGVLYLTYFMLHQRAPCRQHFTNKIKTLTHAKRLWNLLNKLSFVYS